MAEPLRKDLESCVPGVMHSRCRHVHKGDLEDGESKVEACKVGKSWVCSETVLALYSQNSLKLLNSHLPVCLVVVFIFFTNKTAKGTLSQTDKV